MPKYLFTSDQRISDLANRIREIAKFVQSGNNISSIVDKSENNNSTTLQFYYNLYYGTEVCRISSINPIFAIRNFILKFQFPNVRTQESFRDSINERVLLAPCRKVIQVLYCMAKQDKNNSAWLQLNEILYYIFCNRSVITNPSFNLEFLAGTILENRDKDINLEDKIREIIEWKQYTRQCSEMMAVIPKGYKSFQYDKKTIYFSILSPYYEEEKESIGNIITYNLIWYPSKINDYNKAKTEYIKYMDTKKSDYSVISFQRLTNSNVNHSLKNEYRPFITAIKSKPFLLLAGISGTGKSRIVRELARACWDEGSTEFKAQKPRNFEMIQVKPNWHDSSELIGYVSRIGADKEGNGVIFVTGDFLKFVAKAWEEPDVPYFLCLDEMNLAPVEQYFAEYLSVLESRKLKEGTIETDPILRKNSADWYRVLTAELTDDDELRKKFLNEGITIPQNLIVVGTVNMDETTFSFSRKVLDRAMTIEMNEVDLHGGLTQRYEQIGKLGKDELVGNAVEGVDVYYAFKNVCDIAITYLERINNKLDKTPFKIAYRTRNEFLLYVINNLPYNKDSEGNDLEQNFVIARALDEITSMKILSRIEGDESKVSEQFLSELQICIKSGLIEICNNLFDSTSEGNGYDYKSISDAKLVEMKKKLESGYTSFWS